MKDSGFPKTVSLLEKAALHRGEISSRKAADSQFVEIPAEAIGGGDPPSGLVDMDLPPIPEDSVEDSTEW